MKKLLALLLAVILIACVAKEFTGGAISSSLKEFHNTEDTSDRSSTSTTDPSVGTVDEPTSEPSATVPAPAESDVPSTSEPTNVPTSPEPTTTAPTTTEPATTEPEATEPASTEPVQTEVPETTAPETTSPETTTPPATAEPVESTDPQETENADPDKIHVEIELNEYGFELPLNGAMGIASVDTTFITESGSETIKAGTAFTIVYEDGYMWYVKVGNKFGFVQSTYCFINLPDVLPSIVYDNTNSYASAYRSMYKDMNGITDAQLYNSIYYSERFNEDEFVIPVLYAMSKNIAKAQQMALADGNTLVIYEGYRPYATQMEVCAALQALAKSDSEVAAHINNNVWNISWFIATGTSNHQRGYAVDLTLAKVTEIEYKEVGNYDYLYVTTYEEYEMPTPMHELSDLSVIFKSPVPSSSKTDWLSATPASTFNDNAKLLQHYCTTAGLTPLSSEWWHFNDLDAMESVGNYRCDGGFFITGNVSAIPE